MRLGICPHLGEPLGDLANGPDQRPTPVVQGRIKLVQVHHCRKHGSCTEALPVEGARCCLQCPDRPAAPAPPSWTPPVRGMGQAPRPAAVTRQELPCVHLGAELPGRAECQTCSGRVQLKTYACAVHGSCTLRTLSPDVPACCKGCPDRQAPPDPPLVEVMTMAWGIGDAITALTTVAGLRAQYPEAEVQLAVRPQNLPWVRLFAEGDNARDRNHGAPRALQASYHVDGYDRHYHERCRPRWECYAGRAGTTAARPTPLALPAEALAWAEQYRGAIVLMPRAHNNTRQWLLPHWRRLAELLQAEGLRPVALSHEQRSYLGLSCDKVGPLPADRTAALLGTAALAIGVDTGLTHLAGALQRPTLALCGPTPGENLFGIYETVRTVRGRAPCYGCHWHRPEYMSDCDRACAALGALRPEDVLAEALRELRGVRPLEVVA